MTNRERELVAQALRLAWNGAECPELGWVMLPPKKHQELCELLRRLLLSRPARRHELLERLACLN